MLVSIEFMGVHEFVGRHRTYNRTGWFHKKLCPGCRRAARGLRVEAKFILWHEDDVLQIPASSLFRYQQGWAVFVIENNHAKRRVVKVGQRNGLTAQILEGVNEGEHVVNNPSDDVEDGRRVKQRLSKHVIATKSSGTILNSQSVARRAEGKDAWSNDSVSTKSTVIAIPTWQGLFLQSYCISSIQGSQM